ncbi:MAG: hypothetical protein A2268_02340 [Candidatus Raymondbacteria bacterium RifOxyA12_full_50_37]|uniref:Response regulatory domain-containing protein n=1 Tax=Candidatus Raymondbacteria bacterium RIFOXYD12_FULL_49_13 TaxID=1817890 RepID=A0A1F7FLE7_UNCRA
MGLKFLIVDDSANIRAFVKKTLGLTGLEIERIDEATDGIDGLLQLAENPVDVVLTDINMPNMDGLDMIRKIREDPKFASIQIVVISTEGSREKIIEAVKCGANGYLKKPFGPEEVLDILKEAIKK